MKKTIILLFIGAIFLYVGLRDVEVESSLRSSEIDSVQYFNLKQKASFSKAHIEKVTDFMQAKKMLKERVKWGRYDEDSDRFVEDDAGDVVLEMTFGNGTKYMCEFPEFGFVAYYPQEDILLLEGGHTTDISFNLTTAEETENVGNPEYIVFSPSEKYRLNGHFGGQESSFYFIQEKTDSGYRKVIQLYSQYGKTDFERQTGVALYNISDVFWQSDTILNIEATVPDESGQQKKLYYQLCLKK